MRKLEINVLNCRLHQVLLGLLCISTGVSQRTVYKIRKENEERKKTSPGKPLPSPGRKRHRPSIVQKIDQTDFLIIRRLIEKLCYEYNVVPTCNKLLVKLVAGEHVIKIENKYWETDQHMEQIQERLIINLREDSDSKDSFSDISDDDDESNEEN